MKQKKVAIIGYGWVGKAMKKLFPSAVVYSHRLFINSMGAEFEMDDKTFKDHEEAYQDEVNRCDIAFICVPTPCPNESRLDVSEVEKIVEWLKTDLIVIRSTLNPGDCDYFKLKYEKNICFQPEYLGETPNHPLMDSKNNPFLIIGGEPTQRNKLIDLYSTVYNANTKIRQISNMGAEIIKLTENRAIAWKVMQMHELYEVCKAAKLDYYTVRDAVYGDDPRFNLWFTMIFKDNLGFHSSKCLKKDVPAWCAWAESVGFNPTLTRALFEKSKEYHIEQTKNETSN